MYISFPFAISQEPQKRFGLIAFDSVRKIKYPKPGTPNPVADVWFAYLDESSQNKSFDTKFREGIMKLTNWTEPILKKVRLNLCGVTTDSDFILIENFRKCFLLLSDNLACKS